MECIFAAFMITCTCMKHLIVVALKFPNGLKVYKTNIYIYIYTRNDNNRNNTLDKYFNDNLIFLINK